MRRIKSVGLSIPSVVGPVHQRQLHPHAAAQHAAHLAAARRAATTPAARHQDDTASSTTSAPSSRSSPAAAATTAACSRPTCATSASCRSRAPARSAPGSISLPADSAPFDYTTISDVILHVRYTARDGADRGKAVQTLTDQLGPNTTALLTILSLRHDFPTEWNAFVTGTADFTATVTTGYFPYLTRGKTLTLTAVTLFALTPDSATPIAGPKFAGDLTKINGSLRQTGAADIDLPADDKALVRAPRTDAYLVISYTLQAP